MMRAVISPAHDSMDGPLFRGLKRVVPRPVKRFVKRVLRGRRFAGALRRLKTLPAGALPSRELLEELTGSWGNEAYSADVEFLARSLERIAGGLGPVLECGSGLSTIVMGMVGAPGNVQIWSLEHDRGWAARVRVVLGRFSVANVHLMLAPLRDYGGFEWYDAPWPSMPEGFRTVVCDGPPESTPGGRYGLMPVARSRLARDAVVLVDDATNGIGLEVVRRWSREQGVCVELRPTSRRGYAVVTFA